MRGNSEFEDRIRDDERAKVIEECAKAMDAFGQTTMTGEYAANWLRALKSNRK